MDAKELEAYATKEAVRFLKARVWVKPHIRNGVPVEGYWRMNENAAAAVTAAATNTQFAGLPSLPDNMYYAGDDEFVWQVLPDKNVIRKWGELKAEWASNDEEDDVADRVIAISVKGDYESSTRFNHDGKELAGSMLVELFDSNALDLNHDSYAGPFFHNPWANDPRSGKHAILTSMYIPKSYRGRGYARQWAEWLGKLDMPVYGSFTNYGLQGWFYDNFEAPEPE